MSLHRNQPEITIKAVLLAVFLSVVLAAANAYLGLFAGMTISASIPAAVISMAILKWFRQSNILENNIVQTGASAGESLAAGAIFTLPALIILGSWSGFHYWEVTLLAGFGGLLGVLFSIPLRRAFIVESPLRFPEGVATAEVLRAGEKGGRAARSIAWGGLLGALYKLGETGFRLWAGVAETAQTVGGATLYFGMNLSPALVAVGFIVGFNIAVLVFLGGALNWYVVIPLISAARGIPEGAGSVEAAYALWSAETRYLGVGAMLAGGLWTLVQVRESLIAGIRGGLEAYRELRRGRPFAIEPKERDVPMQWIAMALLFSIVPLYFIFKHLTGSAGVSAVMAVTMMLAGFLFSAVAAYMAGVVGSSNNPISGVTIATVLTSSLVLVALVGRESPIGPAAAILIGAVVCCGAAISGDNMQDLKAGRLIGATPFRQQIMQAIGVVSAAFFIAPVLGLLLEAYGIGPPTGIHPNPLPAPQATLMASVARGVFRNQLPLDMVVLGMGIAIAVIGLDLAAQKRHRSFRLPVLAVAVGLYLPLQLSVPIVVGGLIARTARGGPLPGPNRESNGSSAARNGLLFAAGLITGEALMGILIAVLIVWSGQPGILTIWKDGMGPFPGLLLLMVIIALLWRLASSANSRS